MPFVWGKIAKEGQIFGNRDKQSDAHVTNGLKFSYPGYSETFCGFADPRIDSNDYPPNPNQTVFEWLNRKPAFHGRVAAIGAWDAFDRVLNEKRCGFPVNCGFAPLTVPGNAKVELLNRLKKESPSFWDEEPVDSFTFYSALEFFKAHKPRVFFVGLGETDDWAHADRYDNYLVAAHRADHYAKTLWDTAQSMPQYAGKTTLIFLPDHGRGDGKQWTSHGKDVDNAENIWICVLGPDTPPLGERDHGPVVMQSQIAATVAQLLGQDYRGFQPHAGKPINDVISRAAAASR
jgi:hypothetical protein